MPYENLQIRKDGHVAVVHFNRPTRANALNHAHLVDIESAALAFRDDAKTRVVIFTGTGKHFSSGADLDGGGPAARSSLARGSPSRSPAEGSSLARGSPSRSPAEGSLLERRRLARMGERATLAVYNMDQITIAAWNGAAMGGGAVLATAMDLRIGADDCFMQYPEIDIGVNLMWKGLPLLTHIAGPSRSKRLVIGGERIHADELLAWGILDALVPRASLMDTAFEWAARYQAKSPIAAQMIKQSVNAIVSALDGAVMHMDVDQNVLSAMTEDRNAAIAAYRGKTEPTFTGN